MIVVGLSTSVRSVRSVCEDEEEWHKFSDEESVR